MNQKLDPKELKVLADILALVLEDQPGQSANALEAIKKRAKKNTITGGALKNLFTNIANNPPPKPNKTNTSQSKKNESSSDDLIKARSQISNLTQSINQLDTAIRQLRRQNESLRSELLLTQRSRAEMQSALAVTSDKFPFKTVVIITSLLCGLFCGIAGTSVANYLTSHPHQPDNTIYLH